MSSTRHVSADSLRRQNGLASDPIYAAAQGIQGTIVGKKAGIHASARARSLLFFIQALSLPELAGRPNPGGLKRWAGEFLKEFPERIGTAAMHKHGMKPGQVYSAEQVREVREEINHAQRRAGLPVSDYPLRGESDDDGESYPNAPKSYAAAVFVQECRKILAGQIESFLVSLCTDPRLVVDVPGEEGLSVDDEDMRQEWPEASAERRESASLVCFHDILGALFEFQRRFAQRQAESFATTSIARKVFETLDAGLRLRRIVLVKGLEGIGKSEATRAWCAQHLGEARYVQLEGNNNSMSFYTSIARACGLPSSGGLNPSKIQAKISAVLPRSGMMIVIDEAHFVWPQGARTTAPPEIVNWIDTALCNSGVPVGLCATNQFVTRMQFVQEKTGWNSGQFQRRLDRVADLPERPTMQDLDTIARQFAPKASESIIKLMVGFSGGLKAHHLDALVGVAKEAFNLAAQDGREKVNFEDVDAAIKVQSEIILSKQRMFAIKEKPRARARDLQPAPEPAVLARLPDRESEPAELPESNRLNASPALEGCL